MKGYVVLLILISNICHAQLNPDSLGMDTDPLLNDVEARYFNTVEGKIEKMTSRVRLTPYYFVLGESTQLGGVLATLCPQDKKKIHGMVDAIMAPCATKKL